MDASFKDSMKEASKGDYPPTIQPKIWLNLVDGGDSKCVEDYSMAVKVFDFNKNELDCKEMRKGCVAAAIIKFAYVWCSALGCGVTYVAEQVAVKPIVEEKFGFTLGPKFAHLKGDAEEEPAAKKAKTSEQGSEQGSEHDSEQSTGSQGSSRDEEQVDF